MNGSLLAMALLFSPLAWAQDTPPRPLGEPSLQALITDPALNEISGIAASRRNDGIYWVHGDTPRPAELLAINAKGTLIARLRIEGVRAVDWEDIASYRKDGKAWLLIGDIGDNNGSRTHYEVIAVEEPEIDGNLSILSVKPTWRLRFRYEDGARDCEAMAVDVASNAILLINKHAPLAIHSLSLDPPRHTAEVATATRLGALESIPQPDAQERLARFPSARFGGSPTGMDIDASGRLAVVLTYRDAWLFERRAGMSWVEAFGKPLQRLPLPPLPQAEAIGFSADSRYFLIGSENLPAPLLRVDLSTEGGSAEH